MTEAGNQKQGSQIQFGSRDRPVVAINAITADNNDVLTAILNAKRHGYYTHVYVENTTSTTATLVRELGAKPISIDGSGDILEQMASDAREYGFPGIIHHENPNWRLDFEQSRTKLAESTDYTVTASLEKPRNNTSGIVVGIPAYNEEVGIGSTTLAARQVAEEVIVVDDGSTDRTVEIANEAGATVIQHDENRGKGAAVRTLLDAAKDRSFSALVLLDGDGQHDPADIPDIAKPVIDGEADLVIGSRYLDSSTRDETPTYRRVGQRILDMLTVGSSKAKVTDSQSGFRALSPTAVNNLSVKTDSFGVESEMIDEAATRELDIEERSIDARYEGIDGQTQNPLRHGLTVVAFILQHIRDRHPLLFFGVPGIILGIIGVLYGVNAILVLRNTGQFYPAKVLVSGFTTILGTLSLFIGLILNRISTMIDEINPE